MGKINRIENIEGRIIVPTPEPSPPSDLAEEAAALLAALQKKIDGLAAADRVAALEKENLDLRLRLAAARAILRDALSDLGE